MEKEIDNTRKKIIPIICTNCQKIPKLTIKGIVPEEVTIVCPCGERTTSISNYLIELRNNTSVTIEERADISYYFCEDCQKHIRTPKPGPEHEKHKLVELSKLVSSERLKQSAGDRFKAAGVLKLYCTEIITKMKEALEIALKNLNSAYFDNLKTNTAYLDLVTLLEQNCDLNNPNYFAFKNFVENSKILPPKELGVIEFTIKDYDKILEYIKFFNFNGQSLPKKEQPSIPIKRPSSVPPKEGEKKEEGLKNKLNKDIEIDTMKEVTMVTILQDNRLAIGTAFGNIVLYDVAANKECFAISDHTNEILWLSTYDDKLFSTSLDNNVNIYEIHLDDYKLIDSFAPFEDTDLRMVSGMSDNRFLVTSQLDFSIWKIGEPSVELKFYMNVDKNLTYAYPVNGENAVVTLGSEQRILKWDLASTEPVGNLPFTKPILCFNSTKDNTILIGTNGSIYIIDVLALVIKKEIKNEFTNNEFDLCVLSSGLIVMHQNKCIFSLDPKTEKIEMIKEGAHQADIFLIIEGPNNKFITIDSESLIKQWSI